MGAVIGYGPQAARTAALIMAAAQPAKQPSGAALGNALDCLRQNGKLDPVRLGQWLGQHRDRIVDNLQLIKITHGKRASEWYVNDLSKQKHG
jgi:hypothetical protein